MVYSDATSENHSLVSGLNPYGGPGPAARYELTRPTLAGAYHAVVRISRGAANPAWTLANRQTFRSATQTERPRWRSVLPLRHSFSPSLVRFVCLQPVGCVICASCIICFADAPEGVDLFGRLLQLLVFIAVNSNTCFGCL